MLIHPCIFFPNHTDDEIEVKNIAMCLTLLKTINRNSFVKLLGNDVYEKESKGQQCSHYGIIICNPIFEKDILHFML